MIVVNPTLVKLREKVYVSGVLSDLRSLFRTVYKDACTSPELSIPVPDVEKSEQLFFTAIL